MSIATDVSVSLLPNELSPATTALLGRNGRFVKQYTPELAVCEMFESLVRGDLLCNNVETRTQKLQEFRDERGIADAKSHGPH